MLVQDEPTDHFLEEGRTDWIVEVDTAISLLFSLFHVEHIRAFSDSLTAFIYSKFIQSKNLNCHHELYDACPINEGSSGMSSRSVELLSCAVAAISNQSQNTESKKKYFFKSIF